MWHLKGILQHQLYLFHEKLCTAIYSGRHFRGTCFNLRQVYVFSGDKQHGVTTQLTTLLTATTTRTSDVSSWCSES